MQSKYVSTVKFATRLTYKLISGQKNHQTGKWIKKNMIDLGPTYIKMGQIISSRIDVFPSYITDELTELQSEVPAFDFHHVQETFMEEFDVPIDDVFSKVSKEPIASASIGQVHLAKLAKNDKLVVVKVQRPGIEDIFQEDLNILNKMIHFTKTLNNRTINDIVLIIQETANSIQKELDFTNEMNNMHLFHTFFNNNNDIIIPRVYSKYASKRIIVMEYLPGVKINCIDDPSVNKKLIANKLVTNFTNIVLKDGYIHADPHPGNISLQKKTNKIILYDFGIVYKVDLNLKKCLENLIIALYEKDVISVMTLIIENEIVFALDSRGKNIESLTNREYVILYKLVVYILDYADEVDVSKLNNKIFSDEDVDFDNLPFILNSDVILLFKTLTTLEGVCKGLDASFEYTKIIQSLILDIMGKNITSNIIEKVVKDIQMVIKNGKHEKSSIDLMNELQQEKVLKVQMNKLETKVSNRILLLLIIDLLFHVSL